MGIKIIVFVLILGLCSLNCVKCAKRHVKSTSEASENELNDLPVKTIQYFGDVYDCVEFLKQPAFSVPLLKNHAYHNYQAHMSSNAFPSSNHVYKSNGIIGLPDGGCPNRTVPIRRTKEDIMKHRNRISEDDCKIYRAVVRTQDKPAKTYLGGFARMSVYQPQVSSNQNSFGLMTLGNNLESLEVGWMVNPLWYGNDTRSRLYIYTKSESSSCFDTSCGQFIQTNPFLPLGAVFSPYSTPGLSVYEYDFYVSLDRYRGVWQLKAGSNHEEIGFWPNEIFSDLDKHATYIEWGGQTKTVADESGPAMGSGDYPRLSMYDSAHIGIKVVNKDNFLDHQVEVDEIFDDGFLYRATDFALAHVSNVDHYIEYGGPGPRL